MLVRDSKSRCTSASTLTVTCYRFGLRGRKKLCENRRIRVSGPRRKALRALQLQHLNQPFQTDVRECPLVLGLMTHDVRRKGAL